MNRRDFLKWLSVAPVAYSFLGSGIWTPPGYDEIIVSDVAFKMPDQWHSIAFKITDKELAEFLPDYTHIDFSDHVKVMTTDINKIIVNGG